MDIKQALEHLPPPDPHAPDRILARFRETRRAQREPTRFLPLALLSLAALLAVAILPEGERSLELVADEEPGTLAWSEQVDLTFSGTGSVSGTSKDLVVSWEAGTLRAEVEPETGTGLSVLTEEARVDVVGTVFSVRRDALGVTTWVDRGRVAIACTEGWQGELGPGDGPRTCLPTRPALLLGRADALAEAGASPEEVLESLDLGIERAAAGSAVAGELLARRLEVRGSAGQIDAALADADAYLAQGGSRALEVRQFAGWLALAQRGCAAALPYLEPLAGQGDPQDHILLAECLASSEPQRARTLLQGALQQLTTPPEPVAPEAEWVIRARNALSGIEETP